MPDERPCMKPNHVLVGRVGVWQSLLSGGVSSVVHHSRHPVQRRTPNPRFERTAEKRCFSVPRRLRRRAASQASR